jgi:hypothetical protein
MKIICGIAVLIHLVLITCKCTATNAVSISDVESEFVRLRGTCGLWREFLPMVDRVSANSEVLSEQNAYHLQIYTLTNILIRMRATTNDYVYDGFYDFGGARMCFEKIKNWSAFQSSTNLLMVAADHIGELKVLPWEFGCTSNELDMAIVQATSWCSIAGPRHSEPSEEFKLLCKKVRFRRLYNMELQKFRKRALRYFYEVVKYRYEAGSQNDREMIWNQFLDRANASDEERSYFIDKW